MLCLPGYLSISKSGIDDFAKQFPRIKKTTGNDKGYFFEGMNGASILTGYPFSKQDYINNLYGGYSTTFSTPVDHSKTVVFFDNDDNKLISADKNIDNLIVKGKINALLLGSSNQSYYTYVKNHAVKGEFDILLIEESALTTTNKNSDDLAILIKEKFIQEPKLDENQSKNIILTKELYSSISLREIVNEILNI